jgi:hypothetical protein
MDVPGKTDFGAGQRPVLTELEPRVVLAWIGNVRAYSEASQAAGVTPHPRGLMSPQLYVTAREIYIDLGDSKVFPAYVKKRGASAAGAGAGSGAGDSTRGRLRSASKGPVVALHGDVEVSGDAEDGEPDTDILRPLPTDDSMSGPGLTTGMARHECMDMLLHGLTRWARLVQSKTVWDPASVEHALQHVKWRPELSWENAYRPYQVLLQQVYEETGLALVKGSEADSPPVVSKALQRVAVRTLVQGLAPPAWRYVVQTEVEVNGLKSVEAFLAWMRANRAKYEILAAAARVPSRDGRVGEGTGFSRGDVPGGTERPAVGGSMSRSGAGKRDQDGGSNIKVRPGSWGRNLAPAAGDVEAGDPESGPEGAHTGSARQCFGCGGSHSLNHCLEVTDPAERKRVMDIARRAMHTAQASSSTPAAHGGRNSGGRSGSHRDGGSSGGRGDRGKNTESGPLDRLIPSSVKRVIVERGLVSSYGSAGASLLHPPVSQPEDVHGFQPAGLVVAPARELQPDTASEDRSAECEPSVVSAEVDSVRLASVSDDLESPARVAEPSGRCWGDGVLTLRDGGPSVCVRVDTGADITVLALEDAERIVAAAPHLKFQRAAPVTVSGCAMSGAAMYSSWVLVASGQVSFFCGTEARLEGLVISVVPGLLPGELLLGRDALSLLPATVWLPAVFKRTDSAQSLGTVDAPSRPSTVASVVVTRVAVLPGGQQAVDVDVPAAVHVDCPSVMPTTGTEGHAAVVVQRAQQALQEAALLVSACPEAALATRVHPGGTAVGDFGIRQRWWNYPCISHPHKVWGEGSPAWLPAAAAVGDDRGPMAGVDDSPG